MNRTSVSSATTFNFRAFRSKVEKSSDCAEQAFVRYSFTMMYRGEDLLSTTESLLRENEEINGFSFRDSNFDEAVLNSEDNLQSRFPSEHTLEDDDNLVHLCCRREKERKEESVNNSFVRLPKPKLTRNDYVESRSTRGSRTELLDQSPRSFSRLRERLQQSILSESLLSTNRRGIITVCRHR